MQRRQRRWTGFLLCTICAIAMAGCVERRFVITSNPPGASVFVNGQPLAASPADSHFTYYGKYHFTLVRNGFQTLNEDKCISTPWYQYLGLDFISENLIPWTIRDVRYIHFNLEPLRVPNAQDLLNEAQGLRNRGREVHPLSSGPILMPPQPVAATSSAP